MILCFRKTSNVIATYGFDSCFVVIVILVLFFALGVLNNRLDTNWELTFPTKDVSPPFIPPPKIITGGVPFSFIEKHLTPNKFNALSSGLRGLFWRLLSPVKTETRSARAQIDDINLRVDPEPLQLMMVFGVFGVGIPDITKVLSPFLISAQIL